MMTIPIQQPITGNESINNLAQPVDTLSEFYNAFNHCQSALMESNWLNTDEAVMSNPLGGIKRGWKEIRNLYATIFNSPAKVYVEYYDYTVNEGDSYFQSVGRERGYFELDNNRIELAIRTSRMFVLRDGRYRQLHHHGSIEDATLLQTYQDTVLNK